MKKAIKHIVNYLLMMVAAFYVAIGYAYIDNEIDEETK